MSRIFEGLWTDNFLTFDPVVGKFVVVNAKKYRLACFEPAVVVGDW
jgi:hypothetical protein